MESFLERHSGLYELALGDHITPPDHVAMPNLKHLKIENIGQTSLIQGNPVAGLALGQELDFVRLQILLNRILSSTANLTTLRITLPLEEEFIEGELSGEFSEEVSLLYHQALKHLRYLEIHFQPRNFLYRPRHHQYRLHPFLSSAFQLPELEELELSGFNERTCGSIPTPASKSPRLRRITAHWKNIADQASGSRIFVRNRAAVDVEWSVEEDNQKRRFRRGIEDRALLHDI
jgi:hypothetical protein